MSRTRRYSKCDIIEAIVRKLLREGWEIKSSNRHPRLRHPDGIVTITIPKTPSDHRATQNFVHQIRKMGAPV